MNPYPAFDAAHSRPQLTHSQDYQTAPGALAHTPPDPSSPHLYPSSSQFQVPHVYPRPTYLPGEFFISSQYQPTVAQTSEQSQMPSYSNPIRFMSERPTSAQDAHTPQPLPPDTPRQPKASQATSPAKQTVSTSQQLPNPRSSKKDNKTLDRLANSNDAPHQDLPVQHVDTNSDSEQPIPTSARARQKRHHVSSGSAQQRDGQRLKMTLRSATRTASHIAAVKAPELEISVPDDEPVAVTATESDTTEFKPTEDEDKIDNIDLTHEPVAETSELVPPAIAKIFSIVINAIELKTPKELVEDMKERPLVPELKYIHDAVYRALPNL